jgi:transposase-like protein
VNMEKKVIKRYSIAFKRQVVSEYEAGSSLNNLQQRYGIGGDHTVSRWVEQYGREGLRHKLMYIQQPDEQARMKALEARVKELESALAQATLDRLMYATMVEIAEVEYGLDLKKKVAPNSSSLPTSVRKGRGRR